MSYHFGIKKNKPVTYKSILDKINRNNLKIAYSDELDLSEDYSGFRKFYIPNISSRGITVGLEELKYDINVNVLASKDDYLLSCELAVVISKITESEIEPEEEENSLSVEIFQTKYNENWAEENKMLGINMINLIIKEKNETLTIVGCLRNYFLGPDLLNEFLKESHNEEELYNRVINSIKGIQFINEESIRIPNRYEVTEKDESKWEYIVIIPEQEQLIVKTDYIIFNVREDEYLKVLFEDLEKYAKLNFKRLDERQFLFPKMSINEFYDVMKYFGFQRKNHRGGNNKWWKFWN